MARIFRLRPVTTVGARPGAAVPSQLDYGRK